MDLTVMQFLAAPFTASLILTGIHAYLGVHVVERGVIFVDLSLAQICRTRRRRRAAAAGHRRRPALVAGLLDQPCLHHAWRAVVFNDSRQQGSYSTRGGHRHLLRRRLGGGHPRDEQGDVRKRAPQGHARWQHPRRVVVRRRAHGAPVRGDRGVPLHVPAASSFTISMDPARAEREGISIRFWDFLFYASFGFVVTSSVSIAGVLLVFCYLIVPSVGAILYADSVGTRLAIGWTMGTIVSAAGVYLSLLIDLPTGATIVYSSARRSSSWPSPGR